MAVHQELVSIEFAKSKETSDSEEESQCDGHRKQQIRWENMPKMRCDICRTVCTGISNLRRHMKRHSDGKNSIANVARPKTKISFSKLKTAQQNSIKQPPTLKRTISRQSSSRRSKITSNSLKLSIVEQTHKNLTELQTPQFYGFDFDESQRSEHILLKFKSHVGSIVSHEFQVNAAGEDGIVDHDSYSNSERSDDESISMHLNRRCATDDRVEEEKPDNHEPEVSD